MAPPCTDQKRGPNSRLLLNFISGRHFTMFSISLYDDIRRKEASQKEEFANSLYLSNTFQGPLSAGIRDVQERVSERIEKVPGRYVDGTL